MPKPQLGDVEIARQLEVKIDDSERFSALSWLCHHAGQIAKGAIMLSLVMLGGSLGYFVRDAFSGARKADTATPETDARITDGRSLVAKESAGAVAKSEKSEDLAGFSDETKTSVLHDETSDVSSIQIADGKIDFGDAKDAATHEDTAAIEEIVTPGARRSLVQNSGSGASSQPLVGTTVVQNLIVNGTIQDQLIQVGYSWAGSINMTELFGEQIKLISIYPVGKPWSGWLQLTPQLIEPGALGFHAESITIRNNLAYVASLDQGLKIIDISNSSNPLVIGGISGFNSYEVTVRGNLAYATSLSWDDNKGLKIIDISNNTSPVLIGSVSGFYAHGLAVRNNLTYIAAGVDNQGLKIIDISNSTNPKTIEPGMSGFYGYEVIVSDNLAYIATDQGLKIIDISNSTNLVLRGSVSGFSANGLTIRGNLTYVAAGVQGLKIIDISNSTNPVLIGEASGFDAWGVAVMDNLVYVAASGGLTIVDINKITNPVLVGVMSGFDAWGVAVMDNLVYVAAGDGFRIIDLSQWHLYGTPMQSQNVYQFIMVAENFLHNNVTKTFSIKTDYFPYVIGAISHQSLNPRMPLFLDVKMKNIFNDQDTADTIFFTINPHPAWLTFKIEPLFIARNSNFYAETTHITISGDLVYVAAETQGLEIIDISDRANPVLVGSLSGFYAEEIAVQGNLAYVAAGDNQGLQIIDISNSTHPKLIGCLSGFPASGVAVRGNLAYVTVCNAWGGLDIINISNSTKPVLLSSTSEEFFAGNVIVRDNFAYVIAQCESSSSCSSGGLRIIDISDSTHPKIIKPGMLGFNAYGIAIRGNLAYVPAWGQGLKIIDISNSTNPILISEIRGFHVHGVTVDSNLAYVVGQEGLKIFDITQPTNPILVGEVGSLLYDVAILPANMVCVAGNFLGLVDLTNYQFSGTPTDSDVGNYDLTVIATDPYGARAQTSFIIRVEGAPKISPNVTIPPQIALVGQSTNFFLDQGTFYDPNGDIITYTATLANGKRLPYFLSFNPSSAAFSGIPTLWDKGNYMITIFASDRILPPTPANFTLVVEDPIPDQTFIVGRNISCVLPIPPDTTLDERSLVYSVKPRNSAIMPGWMYFNAASRTLFVAPNATNVGVTSMQVTLNDGYGEAFFLFSLNVKFNTPPILASMIPTQDSYAEQLFKYPLPKGTFTDADGDPLTYRADLGGASWLRFDTGSQIFTGTPSGWTDAYPYVTRKYTITVTATDSSNAAATGTFELDLNGRSSWEMLINASIAILGALVAAYGYTHKKYLLWDFFRKGKYRKPVELLVIGDTEFSHRIGLSAEHIKSIIVTTCRDRSCAEKASPCCRRTLGFFSLATKDTEERVFPCTSVYLFPWLFYDSETNTLKSVKNGPTEEFIGKDIKIQVRGTDNRIMEEFHIKVGSERSELGELHNVVAATEDKPSTFSLCGFWRSCCSSSRSSTATESTSLISPAANSSVNG